MIRNICVFTFLLSLSLSTTIGAEGILDTRNYVATGRLLLSNIQLKSSDNNHLLVSLNALNLGGSTIVFGSLKQEQQIEFQFEEAFNRSPLSPYKEDIIEALSDEPLEIIRGKFVKDISLQLANNKPLAEAYQGQNYNANLFGKSRKSLKSIKNKRKITERNNAIVSKSKKKEKADIVDTSLDSKTPSKNQAQKDTKSIKKSKDKPAFALGLKKKSKTQKTQDNQQDSAIAESATKEVTPVAAQKDDSPSKEKRKFNLGIAKTDKKKQKKEKINQPTVEVDATTPAIASNEKPAKETKKLPKISLNKKKKIVQEEKESTSFTSNTEEESTESNFYDKDNCADVVLDTLVIIKNQKDKWLIIEYTIKNVGNRKVNLYGKPGNDEDNLAIKAYLASSPRLSRGSLAIGGSFVHSGLDSGILLPNESYTATIKLDIRKKTKFTPYIVFDIDPFFKFMECDKKNNKNHVFLD